MDLPNCTTPIHRQISPRKLESFGSGILIEAAPETFALISAAHVLNAEQLWLPGGPKFVSLDEAGPVVTTAPTYADAGDDPVDVAFVVLSSKAVNSLRAIGLEFLPVSSVGSFTELPASGKLVCSGFPATKSRNHKVGVMDNTRMDIAEQPIDRGAMIELGLNPRFHVGMHYDRFTMEHAGKRITGALPHGMSGGPIWHVLGDTVTLVAVATDYDRTNALIRGTVVRPVIAEILRRGTPVS